MKQLLIATLAMTLLLGVSVQRAEAVPTLQIYIEGASYDAASATWLTSNSNFNLWVVGNFTSTESILDVRISAAYSAAETGTFSFTPFNTSYNGVTDVYANPAPYNAMNGIGAAPADLDGDGDIDLTPVMSDGDNIANHGIFGVNTNWTQWQLGDMTHSNESRIGDFANVFPTLDDPNITGEIFAYNVTVTGFQSGLHIDAFNHVQPAQGRSGSIFAPYSHDAGVVPEPASLFMLGGGLLGLIGLGIRRKKS